MGALLCSILTTACKKQIDVNANNKDSASSVNVQSSLISFSAANFLFVKGIDNPFFTFIPGTTFYSINTIHDEDGTSKEHIHVTVTHDIKKILGVTCTVVHDYVNKIVNLQKILTTGMRKTGLVTFGILAKAQRHVLIAVAGQPKVHGKPVNIMRCPA